MSEKHTKDSWKKTMTKAQWKKFSAMKDKDIDTSDIPELDDNFWKHARVVMPPHKKAISLRVDEDILKWFRACGKGYQSLINEVLRSYYTAHKGKHPHGEL